MRRLWVGAFLALAAVLLPGSGRALAQEVKPKAILEGHQSIGASVAFAPDGKKLASGGSRQFVPGQKIEGVVKIWDLTTNKEEVELPGHEGFVAALAFSPDGKLLAAAGDLVGARKNEIRLWDVKTRKLLRTLQPKEQVLAVAFSPDGKTLATAGGLDWIELWDVQTGMRLSGLRPRNGFVKALVFSPDSKTLASGGSIFNDPGIVTLWDVASGKKIKDWRAHPNPITALAFSADGATLVSASKDKHIILWDAKTGKVGHQLEHADHVLGVAFSTDGQTLTSIAQPNLVSFWDVQTGKLQASFRGASPQFRTAAFARQGTLTTTGSNEERSVRVWDLSPEK